MALTVVSCPKRCLSQTFTWSRVRLIPTSPSFPRRLINWSGFTTKRYNMQEGLKKKRIIRKWFRLRDSLQVVKWKFQEILSSRYCCRVPAVSWLVLNVLQLLSKCISRYNKPENIFLPFSHLCTLRRAASFLLRALCCTSAETEAAVCSVVGVFCELKAMQLSMQLLACCLATPFL